MAKDKVTIINKAGFPMTISRKFAEAGGLKEKPRILAKPPELVDAIKPIEEPIIEVPVKEEPVKVEILGTVEPLHTNKRKR